MTDNIAIFAIDHRNTDEWILPYIRFGGNDTKYLLKTEKLVGKYDNFLMGFPKVKYLWKKNYEFGNPDYIGICHYRRFFTMLQPNTKYFPIFYTKTLDPTTALTPLMQLQILKQHKADAILVPPFLDYTYFQKCKNIEDLMYYESHEQGMNFMLDRAYCKDIFLLLAKILKEAYPNVDYQSIYTDLNCYHFDMYTMSKIMFNEYCSMLFKIFDKFCEIDYTKYNNSFKTDKWMAYIGERFSSTILKILVKKYNIIHLPIVQINYE